MKTIKKVIFTGLLLGLSSLACFSQNSVENDSLSFKRGGNTTMLIGGGAALVGGIILSYIVENKMKSALKLNKNKSASFFITPAQTGIGLCINF